VIGAVLMQQMQNQPAPIKTASIQFDDRPAAPNAPITRDLGAAPAAPTRLLLRFTPDARVADITALLDNYQATIDGAKGGVFRVQFGNRTLSKSDVAATIARLQKEKIVNFAAETP
jgi:hypothetical protein